MPRFSYNELLAHERRREIIEFILVCSGVLALPLFLLFWVSDLIYAPQLRWEFLALRVLMIPVCLSTNYFIRQPRHTLQHVQIIGAIFVAANSVVITTLIYLADGAGSPYYAGLNLVTTGAISFVPWTVPFLILNTVVVYVPFYVLAIASVRSGGDTRSLLIHSFFIASTVIISLTLRSFAERLRRREVQSRIQLEEELESRERIIKEKTAEGMQLAALAQQFSPQVVQRIQSGETSRLDAVHQSDICAIFIDIVDSTSQVRRMDLGAVNRVISMFMEDTMKVLLKYDITIDKFLGDGVLAFSNDPVAWPDYIERVADAALEVRERIAARGAEYGRFWQGILELKIGIAAGPASVGFFGSDEYFRTYTAIGKVVNLASRLCGAAEPNTILVSKSTSETLRAASYDLKSVGQVRLKGFEDDVATVFQLTGSPRDLAGDSEVSVCPEGHGVLHLDSDSRGIFVLKCRTCGYELSQTTKFAA